MMAENLAVLPDESTHDESLKQNIQSAADAGPTFHDLNKLKLQVELQRSLLGKQWSKLSDLMTRYHTEIIQKHEQVLVDNSLNRADHSETSQLLKKYETERLQFQKRIKGLEAELMEKDNRIVLLEKDRVIKDKLIEKLQAQMRQEAVDYQSELNTLKEVLDQWQVVQKVDTQLLPDPPSGPRPMSPRPKRRKTVQSPVSSVIRPSNTIPSSSVLGSKSPRATTSSNPSLNDGQKQQISKPKEVCCDPSTGNANMIAEERQNGREQAEEQELELKLAHSLILEVEEHETDTSDVDDKNPDNEEAPAQVALNNSTATHPVELAEVKAELVTDNNGAIIDLKTVSSAAGAVNQSTSFVCEFCGKAFPHAFLLIRHRRIHTGEKPFACNYCEKTFTRCDKLAEHHRIHTGKKPLECDVCKKTFRHSSTLARHRFSHTDQKPHSCKTCDKSFVEHSLLVAHRCGTGEKPYQCDFCEKRFTRPGYLKNHQQKCSNLHKDG